ncbi:MAG: ATP-dependent DNA helicase [Lachnospiraceae bacterium]|nr:ATP-dependent DNA helicase [Lachnospiraceae bacterium]
MTNDGLNICVADIRNKIYEAGLLRADERMILIAGSCVLLEHFTGKKYSYRMVDLCQMKAKLLFSRKKPLIESGYQRAAETMLAQASPDGRCELGDRRTRARELLNHIFCDILPAHGMVLRKNQLFLAHSMLDAMEMEKVALCEAEVGIGKTHAYILAAILYRLFYGVSQPVIISTSTVALQKALTEQYIPQISDILVEHRIINKSLTFVVRKGKNHYACDSRVKTYLSSIEHNNRLEDQELIKSLIAIFTGGCPIDLDGLPITNYVKERICVDRCPGTCEFASLCRYRTFLRRSGQADIDFLIVNHNLTLANILNRKNGRNRLFPEHCAMIFDESHKLLEAAREMYGTRFESVELERLAVNIYRAASNHPDKRRIILLCEEMLRQNAILFEYLKDNTKKRRSYTEAIITPDICAIIDTLITILKNLSVLFYTVDSKNHTYRRLVSRIDQKEEKLLVLADYIQSIYWMENSGATSYCLCLLPKHLDFILYEDIWDDGKPYILTSATLSVGGDFTHFMNQTGINLLEQHRIMTVSKTSPFDYSNHSLLYLPVDMPFPNMKNPQYMNSILIRLTELINQTHGHTLVLFTSYRMMEITHQKLATQITDYPIFSMGKGRLETIDAFRKSRNGILLASDSAGEGIDLAGDILSSLIIVKLPFPTPDPILEYERSLHENFHSYLSEVIVPSMLVKLRQWIGRGIRRETDTCVFSILDSRAHERYRDDILSSLPDMPTTDKLEDVAHFILSHKGSEYFAK